MLDLTLFKNWDTPAATPEALEKRPEKQDRPAAPRLRKAKTPLKTRPVLKVGALLFHHDFIGYGLRNFYRESAYIPMSDINPRANFMRFQSM